jgi:hypothetical protein
MGRSDPTFVSLWLPKRIVESLQPRKQGEVYQGAARQLTTLYGGACEQLRTVRLSASVPEKLARVLLEWFNGRTLANSIG